MRPIDADRLLKTIANLDVECVNQKQASIMLNTIQKVFPQIVNDEPTLEAEHGHWVCIEAEPEKVWCDNCKTVYRSSDLLNIGADEGNVNFCPNCGARLGW